MGLIPVHPWLHAVVAVAGAVICLYSFTARFWKGTVLLSEVMAATAIGVIIGPAVAGIVDPQAVFSSETLFYVVEEVRTCSFYLSLLFPWRYYDCTYSAKVLTLTSNAVGQAGNLACSVAVRVLDLCTLIAACILHEVFIS